MGIIKKENHAIYFSDESTKSEHLKTCIEVMKFYYRHKTYNELFCIDIKEGDKTLLKSIIRKFNQFKNIDDEDNEEEDKNRKKNCFMLIYNCKLLDLLDFNLYSLLKNNCSYIIIYENENYKYEDIMDDISKQIKIEGKQIIEEPLDISKNSINLNDKYTITSVRYIGENTSSYLAKNNINKIDYIINFKNNKDFSEDEVISLKILSKINNPYILKLIEYGKGNMAFNNILFNDNPYTIYENTKKYNLYYYIEENGFSEIHSKLIFKKIMEGLNGIYEQNICIKNIYSENIFFDENYNPKIFISHLNFCLIYLIREI